MTVRSNSRTEAVSDPQCVIRRFWAQRDAVLEILARHAAGKLHVLGTVTRDPAIGSNSDIGLVVAVAPDEEHKMLPRLAEEISRTCRLRVDVVTVEGLRAQRRNIPPDSYRDAARPPGGNCEH